jgi:hypothetical protein
MDTKTKVVDWAGRVERNGVKNGDDRPQDPWRKLRREFHLSRGAKEALGVFGISYVFYAGLGLRIVVGQHLVMFDAMSRLAHAYFVWHNAPPKLASVGFVWPPVATAVFLPFTAIKPMATSLAALPLTSALFAAGTLVLLNRLFAAVRMRGWMRIALLAAYGLNPMVLFYAVNGMSESVYLFFLVGSAYWLLRWYLIRHPRPLLLAALSFSIGILSRYEVITWAIVATGALIVVMIRQRVARAEVEGALLAFLAPISYAFGLWLFFNWLILNDPLFWLRNQAPGGVTAAGVAQNPTLSTGAPKNPLSDVVVEVVKLNARLFPFAILVFAALVALFVVRRNLLSLTLAAFMGVNAAFTIALVYASHAESYTQLRYNMRAIPLSLVAVGWIYLSVRPGRPRTTVWAVALAGLVLSAPLTWRTMQTFQEQYLEQAFTRALVTGKDQEGLSSLGGYGVGIAPQRRMAEYINDHVNGKNAILTDDAQTFSVMLLSGRPQLFWDRIDRGDDDWLSVRESPWGRVRFLLVSDAANDLVRVRYPGAADNEVRGLRRVYRSQGLALYRVSQRPPGRGPA